MKIAIYLFDGITALDAIGPNESLSRLPDSKILFVSKKKGMVRTGDTMLGLQADHDIQSVVEADILIVPGGHFSGLSTLIEDTDVLEWIRHIDGQSTWTCSVCTGAFVLGAAGLITGRTVTTHWRAKDFLSKYNAVYSGNRIETDDKYITSAGVSAGIDMGLYLCAKIAGQDMAEAIQLSMQYFPEPPFDIGDCETAATPERVRLIETVLRQ